MLEIKQGYTNAHGEHFPNIRNINFAEKSDLSGNLGKFITETTYGIDPFDDENFTLENGIYLYQSHYDTKKALRIYKDFADYKYTNHDDAVVVSQLQKYQKDVTLAQFPTGIVSIENKVIGQEIPFYEGYCPLGKAFRQSKITEIPTYYYVEILKILKELYQNGIVYSDVHGGNFLIGPEGIDLKIIDFERKFLSFNKSEALYQNMINNLKKMLVELSLVKAIKLPDDFNKTNSLESIFDCVCETHHVLTKKR